MHIKICRKEARESGLWLRHALTYGNPELEKERGELLQEAHELENIFGSICRKLEAPSKTWLQNVWNFDILISAGFRISIFGFTGLSTPRATFNSR